MIAIPKDILPNFSHPLLLTDFLMSTLDDSPDLELQVYALKGLFLLLQKHGLDCPKYYTKLYGLLQAQGTKSIFNMDLDTKSRFLRLLDLSLRASTLPSKLIASFMKRVCRQCCNGVVTIPNDVLFCVSLVSNLMKRHPRTLRLVTRHTNSLSLGLKLHDDPFQAHEADPLKTKAFRSSLWEIEIMLKQHTDTRIRDFC